MGDNKKKSPKEKKVTQVFEIGLKDVKDYWIKYSN